MLDDETSDRTAGDDDGTQPSEMRELDATFLRLKKWWRLDWDHSSTWRASAREQMAFVAGEQWTDTDRAALESQARPVITFNRALAIIKSVAGVEINSRHETVYLPRGTEEGTVKANELLTNAGSAMAEGCDAEDEQSEAFQDTAICGMGWTEQRLCYEEDPDGGYVEDRVCPLEMVWDKSARKKNLKDARRVFRMQKMSLADARELAERYGFDGEDEDLDAAWASGRDEAAVAKAKEERRRRLENSDGAEDDEEVTVVHAQWIEREEYYRVAGPQGIVELPPDRFKLLAAQAKANGVQLTYTTAKRKVVRQALLGAVILGKVKRGLVKDRFTFQCITGEPHKIKGIWFGLVQLMRDPQQWANKWLSQTLHILNTTAKGGILAERDAFENQDQASATYAKPDAITWVRPGAIAKNKIMQKPGTGIPAGYINLLEFAISSIRDVTGINMELLGLRDANQPGVLEAQRKQAAMTILATLFDSLRRFRKNVGRNRLALIQEYLSDGRLVRTAAQDVEGGWKVVKLAADRTMGQFEVIVDDSPASPNQKQETWGMIQAIMPAFRDLMTPEMALLILEYSPLPSKLVDGFKKIAAKPNPDADAAKNVKMAGAEAKVARDQAAAAKDSASAADIRLQGLLDLIAAGARLPLPQAPGMMPGAVPPPALGNLLRGEQFAVEPSQSNVPQLPTVPTAPVEPPLPQQLATMPADGAAVAPAPPAAMPGAPGVSE